jgi:hypothetical protein
MSAKERDLLRSMTLGGERRPFKRKLVPMRDYSKPRALELVLDEEGNPVLEQERDERGEVRVNDRGEPLMRQKQRYRHPVRLRDDGTPACVEVREPSQKQRSDILRAAGAHTIDQAKMTTRTLDMAALQVETVIALTYVPGTDIKVFSDADRAALLSQPAGGWPDDIFEVASPLMNVDEESLEKN